MRQTREAQEKGGIGASFLLATFLLTSKKVARLSGLRCDFKSGFAKRFFFKVGFTLNRTRLEADAGNGLLNQ
ncbi:MAG: hypothetical protein CTY19_09335 [Methylomonas sp.]|nr:MAG: hypothetical protein CTY19_09335 [Methylomonas sp.]